MFALAKLAMKQAGFWYTSPALGACLSGAGSTILAFADSMADITRIEAALSAVAADTDLPGRIAVVEPRDRGATVVVSP